MIFTTDEAKGVCVVTPGVERLTAATANAFKNEVCALVDAGRDQLVIDFSAVSFLDSSGLGALVGVLKKIGNRGEIAVCGLADGVEQMFRITRMDRVFTSYGTVKMAVAGLGQKL